jgi:hypothetical protein
LARKWLFPFSFSMLAQAVQMNAASHPPFEPEPTMKKQLIAAVTLFAAAAGAQAAAVVGGSTLLTAGYADQLQSWLGQGDITLTSLYVKKAGDTSFDFHAAADGQGATFTVMYAQKDNGVSAVIGGYNKDSWSSWGAWGWGDYNYDFDLGDGNDNFIFNLTSGEKREQTNEYSTYNYGYYGPTFGGGHDIYVDHDLTTSYYYGYSYGGYTATSIVDGGGYDYWGDTRIGAIEVFTISAGIARDEPNAAEVPEPASLALVGLALTAAGIVRRRRA